MKQFIVDRHTTPNTPTLEQVPTEKIPVYEDMAAAAADLANLAENQIIATHDTGSELSAPVDTVQSGNMHAVTSNAVSKFVNEVTTYEFANAGITVYKLGRICSAVYEGLLNGYPSGFKFEGIIPEAIRPPKDIRAFLLNNTTDQVIGQVPLRANGDVQFYKGDGGNFNSDVFCANWTWIIN